MINTNYILIKIVDSYKIEVYYFNNSKNCSYIYQYPVCFVVNIKNVDQLFNLLSLFNRVNLLSTRHKLYLGKEICKAHTSSFTNQAFIQD